MVVFGRGEGEDVAGLQGDLVARGDEDISMGAVELGGADQGNDRWDVVEVLAEGPRVY